VRFRDDCGRPRRILSLWKSLVTILCGPIVSISIALRVWIIDFVACVHRQRGVFCGGLLRLVLDSIRDRLVEFRPLMQGWNIPVRTTSSRQNITEEFGTHRMSRSILFFLQLFPFRTFRSFWNFVTILLVMTVCPRFRVQGSGSRVYGTTGFRNWSQGFGIQDSGF